MSFSRTLLGLREERKITQNQVAVAIGTTQRKISYWESGKTEPSLEDLRRISKYYNTSVDYLLGLTNERAPYPRA